MTVSLKLIFVIGIVSYASSTILETETNRNTLGSSWGIWDECKQGSFAYGFQIKVERFSKWHILRDDDGMTGIRFFCKDTENFNENSISSKFHSDGSWTVKQYCPLHEWLVGYRLKVEGPILLDNTGANNIEVKCSDKSLLEGGGTRWGSFRSWKICPKGEYFCGVRTRVRSSTRIDSVGLVTLKVRCCLFKEEITTTSTFTTVHDTATTTLVSKTTAEFNSTREILITLGNTPEFITVKEKISTIEVSTTPEYSSSKDTNIPTDYNTIVVPSHVADINTTMEFSTVLGIDIITKSNDNTIFSTSNPTPSTDINTTLIISTVALLGADSNVTSEINNTETDKNSTFISLSPKINTTATTPLITKLSNTFPSIFETESKNMNSIQNTTQFHSKNVLNTTKSQNVHFESTTATPSSNLNSGILTTIKTRSSSSTLRDVSNTIRTVKVQTSTDSSTDPDGNIVIPNIESFSNRSTVTIEPNDSSINILQPNIHTASSNFIFMTTALPEISALSVSPNVTVTTDDGPSYMQFDSGFFNSVNNSSLSETSTRLTLTTIQINQIEIANPSNLNRSVDIGYLTAAQETTLSHLSVPTTNGPTSPNDVELQENPFIYNITQIKSDSKEVFQKTTSPSILRDMDNTDSTVELQPTTNSKRNPDGKTLFPNNESSSNSSILTINSGESHTKQPNSSTIFSNFTVLTTTHTDLSSESVSTNDILPSSSFMQFDSGIFKSKNNNSLPESSTTLSISTLPINQIKITYSSSLNRSKDVDSTAAQQTTPSTLNIPIPNIPTSDNDLKLQEYPFKNTITQIKSDRKNVFQQTTSSSILHKIDNTHETVELQASTDSYSNPDDNILLSNIGSSSNSSIVTVESDERGIKEANGSTTFSSFIFMTTALPDKSAENVPIINIIHTKDSPAYTQFDSGFVTSQNNSTLHEAKNGSITPDLYKPLATSRTPIFFENKHGVDISLSKTSPTVTNIGPNLSNKRKNNSYGNDTGFTLDLVPVDEKNTSNKNKYFNRTSVFLSQSDQRDIFKDINSTEDTNYKQNSTYSRDAKQNGKDGNQFKSVDSYSFNTTGIIMNRTDNSKQNITNNDSDIIIEHITIDNTVGDKNHSVTTSYFVSSISSILTTYATRTPNIDFKNDTTKATTPPDDNIFSKQNTINEHKINNFINDSRHDRGRNIIFPSNDSKNLKNISIFHITHRSKNISLEAGDNNSIEKLTPETSPAKSNTKFPIPDLLEEDYSDNVINYLKASEVENNRLLNVPLTFGLFMALVITAFLVVIGRRLRNKMRRSSSFPLDSSWKYIVRKKKKNYIRSKRQVTPYPTIKHVQPFDHNI